MRSTEKRRQENRKCERCNKTKKEGAVLLKFQRVCESCKTAPRICKCGAVEGTEGVNFMRNHRVCSKCRYQQFKHIVKRYVRDRLLREPAYRDKLNANSRRKAKKRVLLGKHSEYKQRSIRTWLYLKTRNALSSRSDYAKKRGRNYEYNITLDYLVDLWEKQRGRCALTNITMTHIYNSPYSASIDRIDSSIGYTIKNVQLVCQSINLMKNKYSNEVIKQFIQQIKEPFNGHDNNSSPTIAEAI